MTDRANRLVLGILGLLLLLGGGLATLLGAGGFGSARAHRDIFGSSITRWWNEGGWMSFAVVVAIGLVLLLVGFSITLGQLHRNDGRRRTTSIMFDEDSARGETTLRASAGSRALEMDLANLDHVLRARVVLLGSQPAVELRTVLSIADDADLDQLSAEVQLALERFSVTTGVRADPIEVTLRYVGDAQRPAWSGRRPPG
jgi:hypothetical protein